MRYDIVQQHSTRYYRGVIYWRTHGDFSAPEMERVTFLYTAIELHSQWEAAHMCDFLTEVSHELNYMVGESLQNKNRYR